MSSYFTVVQQPVKRKSVVLFGLQRDFWYYDFIQNFSFQYEFESKDSVLAFELWIQDIAMNDRPVAILISYSLLQQFQSAHLKMLNDFRGKTEAPIILIMDEVAQLDKTVVFELGFDDVVALPFDWSFLNERIQFINSLRSQPVISHAREKNPQRFLNFSVSPMKRFFDIIFASLVILLLIPVMLIIGLCIRLESKGPIIYKSKRAGRGYRIFEFYKFRSMYLDAEVRMEELTRANQYQSGEAPCFFKVKNDPRVTKVGRLLRKTSLDELPQLFNVLKGDMSIVGNRPLPLYEAKQLVRDDWAQRFLAPAGLTGLWQITKRGKDQMSTQERVAIDIEYAKHHSFKWDMNILFNTLPAMIQEEDV